MSTHASIGIVNLDNSVDAIYCHNDGYPEYLGKRLAEDHNCFEDALDMILLGDASFISTNINPKGEHSFEKPEANCSVFYCRDRGEDWHATHYDSIEQYMDQASVVNDADYIYLWNGDKWLCYDCFDNSEINLYSKR